ncbi:hypothetical protein IWX65_002868 [Arthrobacter sp. CAN_A214]
MAVTADGRVGPGRRHKGDRKLIGFRLATEKANAVREIASAEGFEHVSDWVASVVEDRIQHTDFSKNNQQEALPIGRIAS